MPYFKRLTRYSVEQFDVPIAIVIYRVILVGGMTDRHG